VGKKQCSKTSKNSHESRLCQQNLCPKARTSPFRDMGHRTQILIVPVFLLTTLTKTLNLNMINGKSTADRTPATDPQPMASPPSTEVKTLSPEVTPGSPKSPLFESSERESPARKSSMFREVGNQPTVRVTAGSPERYCKGGRGLES
jgi:hypothetical protein